MKHFDNRKEFLDNSKFVTNSLAFSDILWKKLNAWYISQKEFVMSIPNLDQKTKDLDKLEKELSLKKELISNKINLVKTIFQNKIKKF